MSTRQATKFHVETPEDNIVISTKFLYTHLPVGTLAAEAEGRVHVLQHVVHLGVVDVARGARVVLSPDPDELVQVVGAEDGGVAGEVVEVVHDDGHEEVEHEEAAEEDEGDKEGVGEVGAAGLVRVHDLARGGVDPVGPEVALPPALAGEHDVGPGLARGAPAHSTRLSGEQRYESSE